MGYFTSAPILLQGLPGLLSVSWTANTESLLNFSPASPHCPSPWPVLPVHQYGPCPHMSLRMDSHAKLLWSYCIFSCITICLGLQLGIWLGILGCSVELGWLFPVIRIAPLAWEVSQQGLFHDCFHEDENVVIWVWNVLGWNLVSLWWMDPQCCFP